MKKSPASTENRASTPYAIGERKSPRSSRPAIVATCFIRASPASSTSRAVLRAKSSSRLRPPRGELRERRVDDLAAIADQDHAPTDGLDFGQDVRREDHGVLLLARRRRRQTGDQGPDLANLERIEADGGLIENQHRRSVHDRLRESDALPEALRERADHAPMRARQAAALDRAFDRFAALRARHVLDARHVAQIATRPSSRDTAAASRAGSRHSGGRRARPGRCRGRRSRRCRPWAAGSRSACASWWSCRRRSGRGIRRPRPCRSRTSPSRRP